jgi:hypothetical protein
MTPTGSIADWHLWQHLRLQTEISLTECAASLRELRRIHREATHRERHARAQLGLSCGDANSNMAQWGQPRGVAAYEGFTAVGGGMQAGYKMLMRVVVVSESS